MWRRVLQQRAYILQACGPLARSHLIVPLGHLVFPSTGTEWPPKFKKLFSKVMKYSKMLYH